MTQGYLNCSKCGEGSLRVSRVSRYILEDERGDPYLNMEFTCSQFHENEGRWHRENRKCYISDEVLEKTGPKKSPEIGLKKKPIDYHCFQCNTNFPSNERMKHLRRVHPDLREIVYQRTDKYLAENGK